MADNALIENLGSVLLPELIHFLIGAPIGTGDTRRVYDLPLMPGLVLKAELFDSKRFDNVEEWSLWQEFHDVPHMAQWLAPCHSISSCGSYLIQARTTPIETLPEKLPGWMADFKLNNFGMFEDRVVAHDYGNNAIRITGGTRAMVSTEKMMKKRLKAEIREIRSHVHRNFGIPR